MQLQTLTATITKPSAQNKHHEKSIYTEIQSYLNEVQCMNYQKVLLIKNDSHMNVECIPVQLFSTKIVSRTKFLQKDLSAITQWGRSISNHLCPYTL